MSEREDGTPDRDPLHPMLLIGLGLLLAVTGIGLLHAGASELLGWVLALTGGVLLQVGVIAHGVFLGMEFHHRSRR